MPEGEVGQVLFLDVIEEQTLSLEAWLEHRGEHPDALRAQEQLKAYQEYLAAFQPWRAVLLVEGNREPLFRSTERYATERACRAAGAIAFGPQATVFERRAEHGLNLMRRGRPATPEEQFN